MRECEGKNVFNKIISYFLLMDKITLPHKGCAIVVCHVEWSMYHCC